MVGRIFRRRVRGSGKPSAALLELARALERNGLQAAPLPGEAAEGRAGLAGGARSLGLLRISNGPPDFLHVTRTGATGGDLGAVAAVGFHWLIRRRGPAQIWPEGRVEARREFARRQVGVAHGFRWTADDDSAASRAAAERLNGLGTTHDHLLRLLQAPGTLIIEAAPEANQDLLRLSLFVSNREWLSDEEIATLRDCCRAMVDQTEGAAPATG